MQLDKVVFNSPGNQVKHLIEAVEKLPANPYGEKTVIEARPIEGLTIVNLTPYFGYFNDRFKVPDGSENVCISRFDKIGFDHSGFSYIVYRGKADKEGFKEVGQD